MAQNVQQWFRHEVEENAVNMAGGWSRLKIIILMACVLGLDAADKGAVGAIAVQLKHALHIGNIEIGLLVTASTGIGALATLPFGVLTDRVNRVRILAVSMVLWSGAMLLSSLVNSFTMLLLTRLFVGVVVAAAYPLIASLTGDYFLPGERGRIWGYVLSGQLIGAGFGILVAGEMAELLTWRASFWVLSFISLILAAAVWRWLPEPVRGVQTHLLKNRNEIPSTQDLKKVGEEQKQEKPEDREEDEVEEEIEKQGIKPLNERVLTSDPAHMPFWRAVRYILSIRTNVLLIIASACGYFFFTGLQTFALIYLRGRFELGQVSGKLTLVLLGFGAIAGVLVAGRLADRLIKEGRLKARLTVGAIAFFITAVPFFAALYTNSLFIAAPLFFLAAIGFGGTNAPLDAARLDIMHSRLWGRAESVRTTLRYILEALAPITFGWLTSLYDGQSGLFGGSIGSDLNNIMPLTYTFRWMLIPVIIASIILYWARKYYPRDVATVLASEKKTLRSNEQKL